MSELPQQLKYADTHEWAERMPDGMVRVGVTDYAQRQLGDVVFVQLPAVGLVVKQGGECAAIESVKSASGLHAPLSGKIVAVNERATSEPERVNDAPYETWLFAISPSDLAEMDSLLSADHYRLRYE